MPTRLKRPSLLRSLAVTAALLAFQGYLGYHAWRGQFGIDSQGNMAAEIEELKARSASLTAEIDAYRHKVELFSPTKLDPDILTERARALLGMAQPEDLVMMVDPATSLPDLGSYDGLAQDQLSDLLQ